VVHGLLLHPDAFATTVLRGRRDFGGGSEHSVYLDPPTARVIKVTHADLVGDGAVGQSRSVADYLGGLILQNEVFGDEIRLEGLLEGEGKFARLVISQPFVKGRRATPAEIASYLDGQGFLRDPDGARVHRDSGVRVSDAVPDNVFACDVNGGTFVCTIDVQVNQAIISSVHPG